MARIFIAALVTPIAGKGAIPVEGWPLMFPTLPHDNYNISGFWKHWHASFNK